MSINSVTISGNLTRDPELRQTAGGTAVLSCGMAVNDRRKNASTGEWEDVPNFVDFAVFGKRGEALSRFLRKGTKVAVQGRLRYESWEAKDGTKRSRLSVVADEVDVMSRADAGQQGAYRPSPAPQAPAPSAGGAAPAAGLYDADIPF